jgi:hypothetical protein
MRDQASSIAAEMLEHVQHEKNEPLGITIEGAAVPAVIENVVLELLHRRTVSQIILHPKKQSIASLSFTVYQQEALMQILSTGQYRRTVVLDLEGKYCSSSNDTPVQYLGRFKREHIDTLDVPEAASLNGLGIGGSSPSEQSWFELLAAPFIIIGSGILIVYLLFTVRS